MDSRVGTAFGKYSITRLLGKSGMGEVYEAYDTDKGRTVALKILADEYSNDGSFRTRFQRESRAAAILQEPHVIPIHDWGEIDGHLYIDMRLVQGQTLDDLLAKGPADTVAGCQHRRPGRRGARCGPRRRAHPSRCEAAEHHRHACRFRIPGRLRNRGGSG